MKNIPIVTVAFGEFVTVNDAIAVFSGQVASERLQLVLNQDSIGSVVATKTGAVRITNLHSDAVSVSIVPTNGSVSHANSHTLLPGQDIVVSTALGDKVSATILT